MNRAGTRSLLGEARSLGFALRDEGARAAGSILVSGVLADQLAKELAVGAEAGAIVTGAGRLTDDIEVLVHVLAGDPTAEDEKLIGDAAARGIEAVVVELRPQENWTRPFVLTPFVVECRAGEGFPLAEIADAVGVATGASETLASRVPVVGEAIRAQLRRQSAVRSALIALLGARSGVATRPVITLEQVRMASRLRAAAGPASLDGVPVLAATAAAVLGSGFVFRRVARAARGVLPAPLASAAVAAAGTWALAKALDAAQSRLRSR